MTYYNGASNTEVTKKEATEIFDIRFIGAERTSDAVSKETRREIDSFAKDQSNSLSIEKLRDDISAEMKLLLQPALEKLSKLFENENNDIGLARGNVSISHDLRPNVSVGEAYVTEVRDTGSNYVVPLDYNVFQQSQALIICICLHMAILIAGNRVLPIFFQIKKNQRKKMQVR